MRWGCPQGPHLQWKMTDCHFLLDTLGLRVGTGPPALPHHMQQWHPGPAGHDTVHEARGEHGDPYTAQDDHNGHIPSCGPRLRTGQGQGHNNHKGTHPHWSKSPTLPSLTGTTKPANKVTDPIVGPLESKITSSPLALQLTPEPPGSQVMDLSQDPTEMPDTPNRAPIPAMPTSSTHQDVNRCKHPHTKHHHTSTKPCGTVLHTMDHPSQELQPLAPGLTLGMQTTTNNLQEQATTTFNLATRTGETWSSTGPSHPT